MTHRTRLPSRRRAVLLTLLTMAGPAPAVGDPDPIEGVWEFAVTRRDCATGAVLGTQKALSMFQRGGGFANDNSTAPTSHGAMFGSWIRTGPAAYLVQMVFMRFNPDGTLAGTQRLQRQMVLAPDHKHITAAVAAQTVDVAGAVVQRGCANEAGMRLL